MSHAARLAVGLSVGATNLTAVTSDRAVTRSPVFTLFANRPPVVGLPWESGDDHRDERGLMINDFVDRVGDPVGILAADGSAHHADAVLADALRALAFTATDGGPLPGATAVTYPAHWRNSAVDALRRALARVPEWSREPVLLTSDAGAALAALRNDPGLPSRGVIALCDLGGSGTTITVADAATGQLLGPAVRHSDFSGDLLDQALLTHVIGDLASAGSVDLASTSAIGSLTRLRTQCRSAKERLSASTVTALTADLPGYRGDVRLTRTELDEAIRSPLTELVAVVEDTLQRAGVRPADLAAIATVGGSAKIAAVTTTLSEHFRVPVVTTSRPMLTAAIGAALQALRDPADDLATSMAPAAVAAAAPAYADAAAPASSAFRALAWSEAPDEPEHAATQMAPSGQVPSSYHPVFDDPEIARPAMLFEEDPDAAAEPEQKSRWYRSPLAVMVAAIVVILGAVGAIGVVLANDSTPSTPATPTPSIATAPQQDSAPTTADVPPPVQAPPEQQAPAPPTVTEVVPAPVTQTQVVQEPGPAVTAQAPPPAEPPPPSEPPPPATQTVTETVAPPSQAPPSTQAEVPSSAAPQPIIPTIPAIPTIPGLPGFIPQPGSFVQP